MGLALVWLAIATKTTYISFLLGRLFLGMWQAPQESLVGMTVTDAFFLHNRGTLIALYGMLVIAGTSIGPLLSGFIIQPLGTGWPHWILAIAVFATAISMFFFMPETKYTGTRPDIAAILEGTVSSRLEKGETHPNVENSKSEQMPKKRTFVQELAFWGRNDQNVSLSKSFTRPIVLLAYPTVLWASFVNGFALSWNGLIASLVAQLFAPP
jgi:MFS family permease